MPIPIERQSLNKNLVERYNDQKAGGAYDAKTIKKWGSHAPVENSLQSTVWTPAGFKVNMTDSEFDNPEGSIYLKGHSTKKYIP